VARALKIRLVWELWEEVQGEGPGDVHDDV